MDKWAAVDIGSNTVQLLVAESDDIHFRPNFQLPKDTRQTIKQAENGRLPNYFFALHTTRLGASPNPGLLDEARIKDTLSVLQEYRAELLRRGVAAVRVVATSAVRDAANKDALLRAVHELCGWQVEVLCGQEEARLSFWGAAAPALAMGARHILMLDIGGSSSELIRWRGGHMYSASADVGAVRAQVAGWRADKIESLLAAMIKAEDDDKAALAIGAGGTITTAAALMQGCREYSRQAVEGYELKAEAVEVLLATLSPLSIAERCAFSPLLARRGE
ncbi:MAG: hypothetical protein FWF04_05330, partial [Clostridiales bacterium]|nr:hypothetical protein [Clostridiales bacterium]